MFNVTMAEEMARAMAAKGFTEAEIVKVITAVAEGAPATAPTAATATVPTPDDKWTRKGLAYGIRVGKDIAGSYRNPDREGTMWVPEGTPETAEAVAREGVLFIDDTSKGGRGTNAGDAYVVSACIGNGKAYEVGPVAPRMGRRVLLTLDPFGGKGAARPVYVGDNPGGIRTALAIRQGRQVTLTLGTLDATTAATVAPTTGDATTAAIVAGIKARRKG